MTATYEKIASTTTGVVSSFTFNSIPSTYTDIRMIITAMGGDSAGRLYIQYNGNTASNYSWTELLGNGTSVSSTRSSNTDKNYIAYNVIPGTSSFGFNCLTDIQNYSNTTTFKTNITRTNWGESQTYQGTAAYVGLWRQTSAITSIKITPDFGDFQSGSTFTLYGIKAE